MSTRCNIIIVGNYSKLYIYRHSDGYPSSVIPDLREFIEWVKKETNNTVRFDSASQFAGWLIIWGRELQRSNNVKMEKLFPALKDFGGMDWKVGYYEPTTGLHGDIEYVYKIENGDIFYSSALSGLWDADEDEQKVIEESIDWKPHEEWVEEED